MANKLKTIKLTHGHAPVDASQYTTDDAWQKSLRYRVEQIADSIDYVPGQFLERAEVYELTLAKDWKVIIVAISPGRSSC